MPSCFLHVFAGPIDWAYRLAIRVLIVGDELSGPCLARVGHLGFHALVTGRHVWCVRDGSCKPIEVGLPASAGSEQNRQPSELAVFSIGWCLKACCVGPGELQAPHWV